MLPWRISYAVMRFLHEEMTTSVNLNMNGTNPWRRLSKAFGSLCHLIPDDHLIYSCRTCNRFVKRI